ncbi:MAG: Uma2 family endonuclease [Gammaproteobacteria bacterium]|nr:Uma2 family endonuclease [Gammaproteobacteria bacterium]
MASYHWDALMSTAVPLQTQYADRDDVFVGVSVTMYYVEGDSEMAVQPDVFAAFDTAFDPRREVWKTWEKGKLADFVLEMTTMRRKTRDDVYKPILYRRLGVTEYWQYDPAGDYLDPPLKGRRLNPNGEYEPIPLVTSPNGVRYGTSEVLGLQLCLTDTASASSTPPPGSSFSPTRTMSDSARSAMSSIAS